jgi:hypothetical protein
MHNNERSITATSSCIQLMSIRPKVSGLSETGVTRRVMAWSMGLAPMFGEGNELAHSLFVAFGSPYP